MKMNKHYNELKASYLFVDIAHIRRATAWMLAAFSGVQAEAARLKPF